MNAYEIRMEVLKMAHSDCFNHYLETLNNHRLTVENGSIDQNLIDDLYPKSEDIISRANELYKFVEQN
jgi:hypothetical protein